MKQYIDLLDHIVKNGVHKDDRTGTGTRSVFGYQMRFNLANGFPLLTTKKLHFKSIVYELLWFIRGDTNISYLNEHGVHIWDEWANRKGDLGEIYGYQWRKWRTVKGGHIDQLDRVVREIKTNPDSRRLVVSAWNVEALDHMALPSCHLLFQFYVCEGRLSLQLYQRSADVFLGLPFNIASYALLTHMVAQVCGLGVGDLVISLGDAHLYNNHIEQANRQRHRTPRFRPTLQLNPEVRDLFAFQFEDITLEGYNPHPHIKAEISV